TDELAGGQVSAARTGVAASVDSEGRSETRPTHQAVDLGPYFNDRVTEIFQRGKYRSPRSPFVSLALPAQGIGGWAGHMNEMVGIDDSGLRRVAAETGGRLVLPNGVPFATPGPGDAPNILFTSM